MRNSIYDHSGARKYLVARERLAFITASLGRESLDAKFCLTLAITGARISEVLALTPDRIDRTNEAIVFETLKQREARVFRAVPVPIGLIKLLADISCAPGRRLWPWGRTTAWKIVKTTMKAAGISQALCKPKALRHAFAVDAIQMSVSLNIVQRWLGHARLETTAIYAGAIGEEERNLARRSWSQFESLLK